MKRHAGLLVLSCWLTACSLTPVATPESSERPTAAPKPTVAAVTGSEATAEVPTALVETPSAVPAVPTADEADIIDGIQQTLDRYVEAYNDGDIAGLNALVDQENAAFRRLVEQRYRYMAEASAGTSTASMRVLSIEDRGGGYWQAHISVGTSRVDWFFREIDGRWLLSEPSEAEIGEKVRIERERFTLVTYAWAGELNETMAEMMERAASEVETRLGRTPTQRFTLYLRPIFGIRPPVNATSLAWYSPGSRPQSDRIDVFAPGSFAYGSYDAEEGWQGDLYTTLVHEYTHLVYQRSFAQEYRITDWMSEGLAEYVSGSSRADEVAAAVRGNWVIPILAEDDGSAPQDLDHMATLEADNSLAYGLAYSLVDFIAEEYGGLDGYWRLAAAMRNTAGTGRDFYDRALQTAFGIDYVEFDRRWREWLDERYGW